MKEKVIFEFLLITLFFIGVLGFFFHFPFWVSIFFLTSTIILSLKVILRFNFDFPIWVNPIFWFTLTISYLFCLVPCLHMMQLGQTGEVFPMYEWVSNLSNVVLIAQIFQVAMILGYLTLGFNQNKHYISTKNWHISWVRMWLLFLCLLSPISLGF